MASLPPDQSPVPTFCDGDLSHWVDWLRSVAPYVHLHRGKTFVVSVAGEAVADPRLLDRLVMDISLIASLGVRLILVHGARPQIEELMKLRGLTSEYHRGRRITSRDILACVKEACGEIRLDIEAAFSQGLPNTPMQHSRMHVVSGNFVTARPMGVIDGVDHQHTGLVRRVDVDSIRDALDRGFVVLCSPFGVSSTGEGFNLTTEDVATAIAVAMKADKMILQVAGPGIRPDGRLAPELSASEARALLEGQRVDEEDAYNLRFALRAIERGVDRVHVVPWGVDGAILVELFTHDGLGTMISEENMDSIREAGPDDIGGIMNLLEPFEREGILVRRPREILEREISCFSVLEHDGIIYGSAALIAYPEAQIGEMAAFAVRADYQGGGDGERLLRRVEQRARAAGLNQLFVLTTRASHWFIDHGFAPAELSSLPLAKARMYNWSRRSQIFIKKI